MKSFFNRVIGISLIIAAIFGLVFSVGVLVGIWRIKDQVTTSTTNTLVLLSDALDVTGQGLEVSQQAIDASINSIKALSETVSAVAQTIDTTSPLLNNLTNVMKDDLPKTIDATQSSLQTAQKGAEVIDNFLKILTNIPILNSLLSRDSYNPQTPLDQALGNVSDSLNNLPTALEKMQTDLQTTGSSLLEIKDGFEAMAASIDQIENNVTNFSQVIREYQLMIEDLQNKIAFLQTNLATIINTIAILLSLFLVWMIVVQFALLTQGWELLHRKTISGVGRSSAVEEITQYSPGLPVKSNIDAPSPIESREGDSIS